MNNFSKAINSCPNENQKENVKIYNEINKTGKF